MPEQATIIDDPWDVKRHPLSGSSIFEFKEMSQAVAFVGAVKKRFGLDGRAFDNGEEANKEHYFFPWVVYPPVVLIARHRIVDGEVIYSEDEELVAKLARRFGGKHIGH
jgi:hypothetical protein